MLRDLLRTWALYAILLVIVTALWLPTWSECGRLPNGPGEALGRLIGSQKGCG